MIGRKGKRVYPPQFQSPTSVAVDRSQGFIYVADYGNARIQILDVNGNMAREPLVLGGKCRPCALAVSLRGDVVMTDSQILRVFSKTGKPETVTNLRLSVSLLFRSAPEESLCCKPKYQANLLKYILVILAILFFATSAIRISLPSIFSCGIMAHIPW